jgi:hypothetical protein
MKCVVGRLKKKEGGLFNAVTKVRGFINESALIVLLMFTFNEVTLYGFATLKILLAGGDY